MHKILNLFILTLTITSCAQKDFITKYSFNSKVFKAQKYYYTLTSTSNIEANANNNNAITNNTATVSFIYQLQADSIGNKIVKITYDKFYITSKKNDEEQDVYDSETEGESSPLMNKVLAQIKGSTITIIANKNGKILSTTGVNEISTKIANILPNFEDGSNTAIIQQLSSFVGDKFIKENVEQNLAIVPDTAINIGKTWLQNSTINADVPLDASIKYSLQNVENGVGIIDSYADISSINDKPITLLGITAATNLKGNITGNYKLLVNSGFLIGSNTEINIAGTINLSAQQIPVSIKITKKITAKEIQ